MENQELLYQQKIIAEKIINDIKHGNKKIHIQGKSGCGKSYLTSQIINYLEEEDNTLLTLHFQGDIQCIENNHEYYPFSNGLKSLSYKYNRNQILKTALTKVFDFSPVGSNFLEYISDIILKKISINGVSLNEIFNEKECDIILKIKKLAEKHKLLFYLDNLHWWDSESLTLLYLLIKNSKDSFHAIDNSIFICNTTIDQVSYTGEKELNLLKNLNFTLYQIQEISLEEYTCYIKKLNYEKAENTKLVEFLWKITGGHLEVTKTALDANNIELSNDINTFNLESNCLNTLIEDRLKSLGATGDMINEILKFGSLFGLSFSLYEMQQILEQDKYQIKEIIEKAQRISLINQEKQHYKFSHEIIRELFERKTSLKKFYYYPKIIDCFRQLYPTKYSLRIHFLLGIGEIEEIEKLYILDIVQQFYERGTYSENTHIEVLFHDNSYIEEYLLKIKKGLSFYQNSQYIEAAQILDKMDNVYDYDLIAQKNLLISQCYTKVLDEKKRFEAVQLLEQYRDKKGKFIEQHLWTTCMLSLLDAYIHIGQRENSLQLIKELSIFYIENAEHCEFYQYKLNILRRKAMAVYELEISQPLIEKSVRFFTKTNSIGLIDYPIDCYIALVNYASVLLCSGDFCTAHQKNECALELQHNYYELNFPRQEILINNYFMSGVLTHIIDVSVAIENMNNLLKNLRGSADIYFLKSNLAIYYIIIGDLLEAQRLLEPIHRERLQKDISEFSYYYHAEVNLAITYILEGKFIEAKEILDSLEYMVPKIHYSSYYTKRHQLLQTIAMEQKQYSIIDFSKALFQYTPHFQTEAWKYFGISYSFNTLEYWGES